MRYTLLVTGFGPFDDYETNPSGTVAQAVHGRESGMVDIVGMVLPVVWDDAWPILHRALIQHNPIALVMLGAAKRDEVQLELVAKNQTEIREDSRGGLPESHRIRHGGPGEVETGLPVDQFQSWGVATSTDAGRYLCNYIFYQAQVTPVDSLRWSGFIHLPSRAETQCGDAILRFADWVDCQVNSEETSP